MQSGLNKHERKKVIVSSSDGKNAKGGHVLTPTSVLSYRFLDSTTTTPSGEVFESRAADTVRFLINPLWSYSVPDVVLPIQSLFDNVPFAPAMIRYWLQCKDRNLGGLMFPRQYQDSESLEPTVHIVKKSTPLPGSTSFRAEVTISIFRREIVECTDLQPFDVSVWHSKSSYSTWCFIYHRYALLMEEESSDLGDPRLPSAGVCELFRRMMHTHFTDCGLVFGKLWCDFGFADMMIGVPLRFFMFKMLMQMFVKYNNKEAVDKNNDVTTTLPPMFNASTVKGSGQHICAKCLTYKLGSGKMMRCPCREVFYCCEECQKKDWKVHRLVCGFAEKKNKKK